MLLMMPCMSIPDGVSSMFSLVLNWGRFYGSLDHFRSTRIPLIDDESASELVRNIRNQYQAPRVHTPNRVVFQLLQHTWEAFKAMKCTNRTSSPAVPGGLGEGRRVTSAINPPTLEELVVGLPGFRFHPFRCLFTS